MLPTRKSKKLTERWPSNFIRTKTKLQEPRTLSKVYARSHTHNAVFFPPSSFWSNQICIFRSSIFPKQLFPRHLHVWENRARARITIDTDSIRPREVREDRPLSMMEIAKMTPDISSNTDISAPAQGVLASSPRTISSISLRAFSVSLMPSRPEFQGIGSNSSSSSNTLISNSNSNTLISSSRDRDSRGSRLTLATSSCSSYRFCCFSSSPLLILEDMNSPRCLRFNGLQPIPIKNL